MRRRTGRPDPDGRWWFRAGAAAVAAGLVVLVAGLEVVDQIVDGQRDVADERLETRADAVAQAAASEVDAYVSALTLVAAALGAGTIDRSTFESVTAPLADLELGGATSVVYLAGPIGDDEVTAAQRRWRDRGARDLVLEPDPEVDEHLFAIFSRPLDGSSQRRVGIDVAASGPPATALAEARRSRAPAVSSAYQLIIDQQLPVGERQTSFSLTVPVRSGGRDVGWVLLGLRGGDFLGSVLAEASEGVVHVDLMAADQAGRAVEVATSGRVDSTPDLRARRELRVAQASWQLTVSSGRAVVLGPGASRPVVVRAVSVTLAGLVGVLVWLLFSRSARTRIKVADATEELARAEARSREQAALLRTVVDTVDTVGVVVVDEAEEVLLSSPAALRLLGGATDGADQGHAWPGRRVAYRVDGGVVLHDEHPLVRALAGETCDGVEMVLETPGRTDSLRVQVASRPIQLPDARRLALATFRDVTDERRQVVELAGFAEVVAHDLRNPLTVARGYTELLLGDDVQAADDDPARAATLRQRAGRVDSALRRMEELIADLLGYATARDAAYEPEPVDLAALVAEVVDECLAARPADALVPLVHLGAMPVLEGDPGRLRQLFANLVENAFKYVAPGERPVLDVTAETSSGWTHVRVADRGIGVPDGFVHELFDPFTRSPSVVGGYPGTGLGLAICRRVVEAHAGTVTVTGNPGGGSVFVIDLPLAPLRPGGSPDPVRPPVAQDDTGSAAGLGPAT